MNPHITTLLSALQPAETSGLHLLAELMQVEPDPGEYIRRAEEIAEAVEALKKLAERSKKVTRRCQHLQPQSSPRVPAGF